ncbi:MAG: CTP synthase [Thermoprotei archaeon]
MKYVFVTGGVLSSVGKGIITSSIGRILQFRGFSVYAVKMDPYVNVDAGTMNPYQHGEVFVTEDGGETDLDLGHYERFLSIELNKSANITTGLVYREVIEKERRGDYLGQTVQIIPHVVEEIKRLLRLNATKSLCDVLIVETGGTVGDIESLPFLEAIRQLRIEEGYDNTLFVHVPLVPTLKVTGETKTKPAQHSVQELRRIGIQPDVIVARAEKPLDKASKDKLALFTSVPERAIFTSYDVESIYKVPIILEEQGMGEYIQKRLGLLKPTVETNYEAELTKWSRFVDNVIHAKKSVNIGMVGKYTSLPDAYLSITEALIHAGASIGVKPKLVWIQSEQLEGETNLDDVLNDVNGIIVLPGFGKRGTEGKIRAINYARTHNVPYLGVCFGMQLAVVEFARNVVGLRDANSTENDPNTPYPVVDLLPEQVSVEQKGGTMRLGGYKVILSKDSRIHSLYSSEIIQERHRHRYEVNPKYIPRLIENGLAITGLSLEGGRVEAIELKDRLFFLATQFHPEFKSRPLKPSPPYLGLLKAALVHAEGEIVEKVK